MTRDYDKAKIVLHYGDQWSVFSGRDRYCEHRLFWSVDHGRAKRFARAYTRWVRSGCLMDGSRPLGVADDGSIYRQRDFDAPCAA